MSIRKSLFLSNAAMVIMPTLIFILYFALLNVLFSGDFKLLSNNYHRGWQTGTGGQNIELFNQLKKTASLEEEKFSNPSFQVTLSMELEDKNAGIIIRKSKKVLFSSDNVSKLQKEKLPAFGNEGYQPMVRLGQQPYSIRQHDFYFKDGTEGTILLLDKGVPFIQFARRFFPMIFIGFVLILVLTNSVLSYLMSRRILKPINQMSEAASKISAGNLDFHLEPIRKDELGKLVKSFDEMRKKLKKSADLREQYENNRRELIANISHDLKTPITSIRGYVEGIKDGVANTKEKLERYLDTIHVKATHMDRLINELFLFSKLDVNSVPFNFEKVELNLFLEDYLEEIRLDLSDEGTQIVMVTNFRIAVFIDRDKIIRVINNIIFNSVKYIEKGKCRIQISFKEQGKMVKVSICDNGPGVPADEIANIFDRFYRGDPSRSSDTGGSGLGLAIAAQIIQAHGGEIWAENSSGGGLSIHFTLPRSNGKGDE
ncbi:sensor histidine kinase [Neobacillus bataviensis]|uniref:sensor histidine kinase n=1 Tax=Neobacillus bataviensis TaxID=220685 RepID=UPI001CBDB31F|nr:HAMP domain-containing sensor histidine kinase [Neobacillus bataviensis]